jgi:hypothetical protein
MYIRYFDDVIINNINEFNENIGVTKNEIIKKYPTLNLYY